MGKMKIKLCIFLLLGLLYSTGMQSQNVAIKTNLLSDAFLNINAGVEIGVAP